VLVTKSNEIVKPYLSHFSGQTQMAIDREKDHPSCFESSDSFANGKRHGTLAQRTRTALTQGGYDDLILKI
jgi:hypothetical protein